MPTINDKNYFNFKVNFIKQNKLLDLFSSIFIFYTESILEVVLNCLLNLLHLCYCIVHLLICKVWLLLVTKVQILTVLQWPDIPGIYFRYSQTGLAGNDGGRLRAGRQMIRQFVIHAVLHQSA